MKVIIAGSRDFTGYGKLCKRIKEFLKGYDPTEIVSGGAKGADELGERYARAHKIPLKVFSADWKTYGKAAGPIRNQKMADYADVLIAFWDGESRGTKNMIKTAHDSKLDVYIVYYENEKDSN